MEIVCDNSPMMLQMPIGENCPIDLKFKECDYVINADGSYTIAGKPSTGKTFKL